LAFNHMAMNLKEVTSSKVELRRKLSNRERVEEALRNSEEKFRLIAPALLTTLSCRIRTFDTCP